jgi:hypothetical protein
VAELVGGDVADASVDGLVVEDLADPVAGEGTVRSMRRRSERTPAGRWSVTQSSREAVPLSIEVE